MRLASADDAGAVVAIYGPIVERTAISFEVTVPTVAEMAGRIVQRQPAHPWIVAQEGERVVGYACAGRFSARAAYDWSVEVSAYVAEGDRGRGVGRALYATLLALLGAQGYRQAMAGIALPNEASVGLHESLGFTQVGTYRDAGWKLGAWHDVGWWQRAVTRSDGDRSGAPSAPVPLDVLPAEVVDAALGDDA